MHFRPEVEELDSQQYVMSCTLKRRSVAKFAKYPGDRVDTVDVRGYPWIVLAPVLW